MVLTWKVVLQYVRHLAAEDACRERRRAIRVRLPVARARQRHRVPHHLRRRPVPEVCAAALEPDLLYFFVLRRLSVEAPSHRVPLPSSSSSSSAITSSSSCEGPVPAGMGLQAVHDNVAVGDSRDVLKCSVGEVVHLSKK